MMALTDFFARLIGLRPLTLADFPEFRRLNREEADRRARHRPTRDIKARRQALVHDALRRRG